MQPCKAETLIGTVTKDGRPVSGMEIRVSNLDTSISVNTYPSFTNENGEYSFTNLPGADNYVLEYYWAGSLVRTKRFNLYQSLLINEKF